MEHHRFAKPVEVVLRVWGLWIWHIEAAEVGGDGQRLILCLLQ